MPLKRVVTLLDETLVEKVDFYAKSLYLNRTAAITVLLTQALQSQKIFDTLDDFTKLVKDLQLERDLSDQLSLGD